MKNLRKKYIIVLMAALLVAVVATGIFLTTRPSNDVNAAATGSGDLIMSLRNNNHNVDEGDIDQPVEYDFSGKIKYSDDGNNDNLGYINNPSQVTIVMVLPFNSGKKAKIYDATTTTSNSPYKIIIRFNADNMKQLKRMAGGSDNEQQQSNLANAFASARFHVYAQNSGTLRQSFFYGTRNSYTIYDASKPSSIKATREATRDEEKMSGESEYGRISIKFKETVLIGNSPNWPEKKLEPMYSKKQNNATAVAYYKFETNTGVRPLQQK